MIELAETLQAPVQVGTNGSWQKFPSWHPLYGNGGRGYTPDVLLGLEVGEMSNQARTARESGRKTISISSELLFQHSNIHDYGHYADVDLAIAADAEATLPSLIEEITRLVTPRKEGRDGGAWRARGRGPQGRADQGDRGRPLRVGREPGQRAADALGARRSNQERRLGHRLGPSVHGRLAAETAEPRQALALQRRLRRVRHRLRRARIGRRRARAQEGGAPSDRHLRRRRPELQPRRAVDGRASQDSRPARRSTTTARTTPRS